MNVNQYRKEMKERMKRLYGNMVLHPAFGSGFVSDVTDDYISVRFEDRVSKFVNNETFFQYCQVQDENLNEMLQSELKELKEKEEEYQRLFRIEMEKEAKMRQQEEKKTEKKIKKRTRKTK